MTDIDPIFESAAKSQDEPPHLAQYVDVSMGGFEVLATLMDFPVRRIIRDGETLEEVVGCAPDEDTADILVAQFDTMLEQQEAGGPREWRPLRGRTAAKYVVDATSACINSMLYLCSEFRRSRDYKALMDDASLERD